MAQNEEVCKACDGDGMLADDEGWQYNCSVCHGVGVIELTASQPVKILEVDENNRLLD